MEGTHSISLSLGSLWGLTMATTNPWLIVAVVGMVCVTVIAVKKFDGDSKKQK